MSRKFIINNVEFSFTDENEIFLKYLKHFRTLARIYAEKFKQDYLELGNFNNVYEQIDKIGGYYIRESINSAVEIAIKNGVYDIDFESFLERDSYSRCATPWLEAMEWVEELHCRLEGAYLSEEERRNIRKENRGQLIGGGFGISGAAKGIITAGAINAATGVAHSIFNSIGNAIDRSKLNNQKREIYNSEEFFNILVENLSKSISAVGVVLAEEVLELDLQSNINIEGDSGVRKAEILINNLNSNKIPESDIPNIIVTILKNATLLPEAYSINFSKYLSKTDLDEVLAMKKYLDIDGCESNIKAYCLMNNIDYTEIVDNAFNGDADSQYNLYKLIKDKNEDEALKWLHKAVDGKNRLACLDFINLVLTSDNLDKYDSTLIQKFKDNKIINLCSDFSDIPEAYYLLGKIHLNLTDDGQNIDKAIDCFKKCLDNAEALYELSLIYRNIKFDFYQALQYVIEASDKEYKPAIEDKKYYNSMKIIDILEEDSTAEYNLAKLYLSHDRRVIYNDTLSELDFINIAVQWFNKSYEHGNYDALGELGCLELRHPELVESENSIVSALKKITKAAENGSKLAAKMVDNFKSINIYNIINGDGEAAFNLYKLLIEDNKINAIIKTDALYWLKESVNKKYIPSYYLYAKQLLQDYSTFEEGKKYLVKAALHNDKDATNELIEYCSNSEDKEEIFNRLVENNNPYIMEYIGKGYDLTGDPRAYSYLQKSAEFGLEYSKAFIFEQHFEGVEDKYSDKEAFEFLDEYIKHWDTRFIYTVGKCYCDGLGCQKDWNKSVELLRKFVHQTEKLLNQKKSIGYINYLVDSYERLGKMLSTGDEKLTPNLLDAMEYYEKAAELGSENAKEWLQNDINAEKGRTLLLEREKALEIEAAEKRAKERALELEAEERKAKQKAEEKKDYIGCLWWIVIIAIVKFLFF